MFYTEFALRCFGFMFSSVGELALNLNTVKERKVISRKNGESLNTAFLRLGNLKGSHRLVGRLTRTPETTSLSPSASRAPLEMYTTPWPFIAIRTVPITYTLHSVPNYVNFVVDTIALINASCRAKANKLMIWKTYNTTSIFFK